MRGEGAPSTGNQGGKEAEPKDPGGEVTPEDPQKGVTDTAGDRGERGVDESKGLELEQLCVLLAQGVSKDSDPRVDMAGGLS